MKSRFKFKALLLSFALLSACGAGVGPNEQCRALRDSYVAKYVECENPSSGLITDVVVAFACDQELEIRDQADFKTCIDWTAIKGCQQWTVEGIPLACRALIEHQ